MKRYNYKTKKIYESASVFSLSLNEYDGDGKLIDTKDFEDTYSTVDDAIEDAYNIMKNVADNDGFDEDDILYDEDDDTVTFTIDGIGSWVFIVNNKSVEGVSDDYDTDDSTYDDDSYDDSDDNDEDKDEDNTNESVAERFARLRRMFESEDSDDASDDKSDDDDSDDNSDDDDASDDKSDDDENEDEEMQAVIITVKKGDEDKCKDELIDAGIAEEDIEILDADEDAENVDIRIDVNSVIELKDYLSKKGIDLEEEIGGEIVSDDDETDDENEDGSEEEDENKEGDDEEDFDFDNLGDIFGADEDDEK